MKIKNLISIFAALFLFGTLSACDENELKVLPDPPIKADVLYIIGNGTMAEWELKNAIPLKVSPTNPNIFVYDGFLKKGEVKLVGVWNSYVLRLLAHQ